MELPLKRWTKDYKTYLEEFMTGDRPYIDDLREYHTNN